MENTEKTIYNSFWTWLFQKRTVSHPIITPYPIFTHEEYLGSLFLAGGAATAAPILAILLSWWYLFLCLCIPVGALGMCHAFWREHVKQYEEIPLRER